MNARRAMTSRFGRNVGSFEDFGGGSSNETAAKKSVYRTTRLDGATLYGRGDLQPCEATGVGFVGGLEEARILGTVIESPRVLGRPGDSPADQQPPKGEGGSKRRGLFYVSVALALVSYCLTHETFSQPFGIGDGISARKTATVTSRMDEGDASTTDGGGSSFASLNGGRARQRERASSRWTTGADPLADDEYPHSANFAVQRPRNHEDSWSGYTSMFNEKDQGAGGSGIIDLEVLRKEIESIKKETSSYQQLKTLVDGMREDSRADRGIADREFTQKFETELEALSSRLQEELSEVRQQLLGAQNAGGDTDASDASIALHAAPEAHRGLNDRDKGGTLSQTERDGGKEQSSDVFNAALSAIGARIMKEETTGALSETSLSVRMLQLLATIPHMTFNHRFRPLLEQKRPGPEIVLEDRPIRGPGDCYCVQGDRMRLAIALSTSIYPRYLEIEHVQPSLDRFPHFTPSHLRVHTRFRPLLAELDFDKMATVEALTEDEIPPLHLSIRHKEQIPLKYASSLVNELYLDFSKEPAAKPSGPQSLSAGTWPAGAGGGDIVSAPESINLTCVYRVRLFGSVRV